jgi:hypothetical protein
VDDDFGRPAPVEIHIYEIPTSQELAIELKGIGPFRWRDHESNMLLRQRLEDLNEPEFINGKIYANVSLQD